MDAVTAPLRATTSDQAYEAILDAILDGRLEPDEPLRLQTLAQTLGMSVMPVREAIRRLEALGVIEVEPYRGARVRRLSTADLVDTYRTRILLEGYLMRRAAGRFTEARGAEAAAHLDEQLRLQELGDREGARRAHRNFHFALYHAGDAPWAVRSVEPTWANSERYRIASSITAESVRNRRREHEAMLDACASHAADAAERALRDHLLRSVVVLDPLAAEQLAAELGTPLPH